VCDQITRPCWVQSMPGWRPAGGLALWRAPWRDARGGQPADVIESEYDTMSGSRRLPVAWLRCRRPGGLAMSSRSSTVHFGHARAAGDGGAGTWPRSCMSGLDAVSGPLAACWRSGCSL
jgi:hypothetical protein